MRGVHSAVDDIRHNVFTEVPESPMRAGTIQPPGAIIAAGRVVCVLFRANDARNFRLHKLRAQPQ